MANVVSKTAYYTLGVRVADAAAPRPLCGDRFASTFFDEEARQVWERFKDFHNPNASTAVRHRCIDDLLRAELSRQPDARVVVIGAGFDTRAYRLDGGRWLEVDEPVILSRKDALLPAASAKNPLERVSIEFATESLADRLAPYQDTRRTHVVIEGVFMYLTHAQRQQLLETLQRLFPHHALYCDLMQRTFVERYSQKLGEAIAEMGARFQDLTDDPEAVFLREGYSVASATSIPLLAAELGGLNVPPFVVRWLLRSLRQGYQVWKFESKGGPPAAR